MYKLIPNYSLKDNNSFGIDVRCSYWLTMGSVDDWQKAMMQYPHLSQEKRLIIGSGTNLLFLSDFDGMVISPDFCDLSVTYQDSQVVEVTAGAGVEWDEFVSWCVEHEWYGVENLSLIPGKVGAVPVQNIGAYGVEVGSVIVKVNGFNLETSEMESYSQGQCQFSYRSSLFKEQLMNGFMVTSVVFRLQKRGEITSGYGDLKLIMDEMGPSTIQNVRNAVIRIRSSKLPDPRIVGNAGSFFKNPVLTREQAANLAGLLPGLPVYPHLEGSVKVAAGFLIDKAGWKGHKTGRAAVHDQQALVLLNRGGATGEEILALSMAIQQDVLAKYGVRLEREVQVIE